MNLMTSEASIHSIALPTPFPVGDINVYLCKGDALTLIDAGPKTEEALQSLKTQLKGLGYRLEDIEQVFLTHHHPDHVGLLDYFDDIPIIGHPYNQPWISNDALFKEKQTQFLKELFTELGISKNFTPSLAELDKTLLYSCSRSLTRAVREGDEIPGMKEYAVLETPGHAQSHLALYHKENASLIGGDLLLAKISANPLLEMPMEGGERPRPQLQFNESFRKILSYPVSAVYPGHGETIEEAHSLIRYRMKKQEERAEGVYRMLKEKPMTAFEVCRMLFPSLYSRQLMLTVSETAAQLDDLEHKGRITAVNKEGTNTYKVIA
ncbi:MBL fold metallo-hydrolase [Metabacillus sp. GX 13764]|uniref:MBL fold metallo-hydrolase n=1 Tax=Metabacillus kandeliae TaxID=2900151 RepID=UPI001E2CDAB3|nr:MBL fold metallo-hydrolase [Metabacillus kandeliae]MCD7033263.1 MBL fold metallo-hydrolase [Metabacillus kandeliae]